MIKPIYLLILLMSMNALAQFGPQQIISNEAFGARSVFVIDIDGDNLKDVVTANKFDNSIFWFKNINGSSFGPQQTIASLSETINVYSADLDGDEDMDVLAVAPFLDLVVWYENLDGLGNFGSQNIIGSGIDGAYTVIAADIDGDLDMDVVSGSDSSGIAWYENLDGSGNFGSPIEINFSSPNTRSVMAVDIDGDTDFDIVSSSSGSVTVSWYKNLDGQGGFGSQRVIAGAALTVQSIYAEDLDGDEDVDVVAATNAADKVAWFENTNGQGLFGAEVIITTNAEGARSVFVTDLDNDSDMDVLSASTFDHKIAWYENIDGQANFGPQQVISTETNGAPTVFAADIDNDNDMDVFSTFEADHTIAWYENLTILAIDEFNDSLFSIYPNPAQESLFVDNNSNSEIISIKIFDVLGRLVLQEKEQFHQLNISSLESGVLFVEILTDVRKVIKKVIKE
jgi:hypothetical protein